MRNIVVDKQQEKKIRSKGESEKSRKDDKSDRGERTSKFIPYCKSVDEADFPRSDPAYIYKINQLNRRETETKAILNETLHM